MSFLILIPVYSPNFDERPFPGHIDSLIIHYTAMENAQQAIAWLTNPLSKVSAHYVICDKGHIYQLIPDIKRAWHAGVSSWQHKPALNDHSIGIELSNLGEGPFNPPQIRTLVHLCKALVEKHAISPFRILGHSDIAPQRKQDPGPYFPWKHLAKHGLGMWVSRSHLPYKSSSLTLLDLKKSLRQIGYKIDLTETKDEETLNVVKAFMAHFLPELYLKHSLRDSLNAETLFSYTPALNVLAKRLLGVIHSET